MTIIKTVLTIAVLTTVSFALLLGEQMNGSGTELDPYQITSVEQLQDIRNDLDAHYKLMNNIDATATTDWNANEGFEPLGSNYGTFNGSLNGSGYSINGLTIKRFNRDEPTGLFGITSHAEIDSLYLTNISIQCKNSAGAIVGMTYKTKISNSGTSGTVNGMNRVGGLVGTCQQSSKIINCFSSSNCAGVEYVGGLVGDLDDKSSIDNSFSNGTLSDWNIPGVIIVITNGFGGIAGKSSLSSIRNCYSAGTILGEKNVGGIAGVNDNSSIISNSFSVAKITVPSEMQAGSVCGQNHATASITNTLYSSEQTGFTEAYLVNDNSEPQSYFDATSSQMITETFFTDRTWDFEGESVNGTEEIWYLENSLNHPQFVWYREKKDEVSAKTNLATVSPDLSIQCTNRVLHLSLPTTETVSVIITNLRGQVVHSTSQNCSAGITTIDLKNSTANGIYIVHITSASELFSKKISVTQ